MSHKAEATYQGVRLLNALEAALAIFNRGNLYMELAPWTASKKGSGSESFWRFSECECNTLCLAMYASFTSRSSLALQQAWHLVSGCSKAPLTCRSLC